MSHPAPGQLYDLREWLLSQIDGSEETRGDDSLISHFIRQIDALPSEITPPPVETFSVTDTPRTDAAEVAMLRLDGDADVVVAAFFAHQLERELIDIKGRLLPQANGRAERAENARRMAVVERDALLEQLIEARSATAATDLEEFVRVARTFSDEHYQNALVAELRRVYRAQEETVIGHARYEYIRTLNPRQFAALYDDALADERFDDLVDRYRDAGGLPK